MSTKDTLENMARNTWLAGLGSIGSSKEALSKSIDIAQEKSNSLYNEILTRGEDIQTKINDQKDVIQAKGKKFLGIGSEESHEEKLAQLNATVDQLTSVVVKLIEKRNSIAAPAVKVTPKSEKIAAKSTSKAELKSTATAKPVSTAKKTEKAVTKSSNKKAN